MRKVTALAHTIATGEPHDLNRPFAMTRFETGELIDEHGGPRLEDAYLRVMRGAVTEVPG